MVTGANDLDFASTTTNTAGADYVLADFTIARGEVVGAATMNIGTVKGAANAIKLSDDGTDRFLVVGSKTSFSHFDQSTAGVILGTDGGGNFTVKDTTQNTINYL